MNKSEAGKLKDSPRVEHYKPNPVLPAGITPRHLAFCLALAEQAAAKGNPPVGCLIIRNGKIIARAAEAAKSKQNISCHAEMEALRKARKKTGTDNLSDCLLLSTHEPCVMCGYAIRFHKIGKVIYGKSVPFLGSVTSAFNVLTTEQVPAHWQKPPEIVVLDFDEILK